MIFLFIVHGIWLVMWKYSWRYSISGDLKLTWYLELWLSRTFSPVPSDIEILRVGRIFGESTNISFGHNFVAKPGW